MPDKNPQQERKQSHGQHNVATGKHKSRAMTVDYPATEKHAKHTSDQGDVGKQDYPGIREFENALFDHREQSDRSSGKQTQQKNV